MSVQIRRDILAALAGERYVTGESLPSVRGLAAEILVNPNTVAKVYRDLERDGIGFDLQPQRDDVAASIQERWAAQRRRSRGRDRGGRRRGMLPW